MKFWEVEGQLVINFLYSIKAASVFLCEIFYLFLEGRERRERGTGPLPVLHTRPGTKSETQAVPRGGIKVWFQGPFALEYSRDAPTEPHKWGTAIFFFFFFPPLAFTLSTHCLLHFYLCWWEEMELERQGHQRLVRFKKRGWRAIKTPRPYLLRT